jgi:hypothetical protein
LRVGRVFRLELCLTLHDFDDPEQVVHCWQQQLYAEELKPEAV